MKYKKLEIYIQESTCTKKHFKGMCCCNCIYNHVIFRQCATDRRPHENTCICNQETGIHVCTVSKDRYAVSNKHGLCENWSGKYQNDKPIIHIPV